MKEAPGGAAVSPPAERRPSVERRRDHVAACHDGGGLGLVVGLVHSLVLVLGLGLGHGLVLVLVLGLGLDPSAAVAFSAAALSPAPAQAFLFEPDN